MLQACDNRSRVAPQNADAAFVSQRPSEILSEEFPRIVAGGNGTRVNPFVIQTPSPTASRFVQIFLLERAIGNGSYERSARRYCESALGPPGNLDLCECWVNNGSGDCLWFDVSFVTKLSEEPSLHAERNRIEEAMPLAFGRFFVVDASSSFEASRQIIFRLDQAKAEGWRFGNAVPKAWLNEYDITKDGVNSKLLFDLRPTIDRVHRLELTPEAYIGTKPSKKRVARVSEQISQITQRTLIWKEMEELVNELKLVVKGWGKYFRMRNAPS
jgi:Group II intron, maturase-specific domain